MSKHFPHRQGDGSASAPGARGGAAPLDKMGSRVSPEESERIALRAAERRQMREAAGALLSAEAVARCGRYSGRGIEVAGRFGSPVYVGAHGAYFGNIVTCKSVWHCAVCAAKIAEERRREIAHVVNAAQAAGCAVFMLTFTQGHKGFHEPKALRQAVTGRWRRMLAGKGWQEIRANCRILGFCRALEVTHGQNGWHPHLHILVFFEAHTSAQDVGRALCWLTSRWVRYAVADGYECSENAQNLRDVRVGSEAGEYISKFGVDWEMSHAHLKKSRGGRTPFQILADYKLGRSSIDADLFTQYGVAFKGARQLTWSGKIRKMFPEAQADARGAMYRNHDRGQPLCTVTEDVMREIDAKGIRELVLDAAGELGFQGLIWALESHGIAIAGVFPSWKV
jgi:hypothetical protein